MCISARIAVRRRLLYWLPPDGEARDSVQHRDEATMKLGRGASIRAFPRRSQITAVRAVLLE